MNAKSASTPEKRDPTAEGTLIPAPNDFRKHIVYVAGESTAETGAVERAERALAGLSNRFSTWMQEEIVTLTAAGAAIARDGISVQTRDRLYFASHNLRGQSQMMNFPLVGFVTESLCNLLDRLPTEKLPLDLIAFHIDSARAIVDENAAGESNRTALHLTSQLAVISERAIRQAMVGE